MFQKVVPEPGRKTVTVSGGLELCHDVNMPMRSDCKHYETRTYATGDVVRKCNLDLAPEAPWRCPSDCGGFAKRLADVNWQHGTLITPPTPEEPESVGDGTVAALLDDAEGIVNAAVPAALADLNKASDQKPRDDQSSWRRRFGFGRKR